MAIFLWVSRFGLAEIFNSASALLSLQKFWFMDTVFMTLSPAITETFKWPPVISYLASG